MKTTLIKVFTVFILAVFSLCGLFNSTAFAATDICGSSAPAEVKAAAGCGEASEDQLTPAITAILNGVISIASLVAVIFIIVGGVNYMTSSGDSSKVEKARKTILYACIGLIVCALAFAIVNLVIGTILQQ